MSSQTSPDHEVIVIGAGFSGIGAGIKLDQAGFHDYVILEAGDGVGGAWHWNTYPGVAVDIPSFSYQFSFETRADWSRVYAPGNELKAYAEDLVDKYHLRPKLRFGHRVEKADFDEEHDLWTLTTTEGKTITGRYMVGATGVFTDPRKPDIPGVDDFAGISMHTARWDHDVDLKGKKVAIIGTGASAVQVIPSIAPEVEHLTVFQRTPIWCMPKPDAPIEGPTKLLLNLPFGKRIARLASQAYVELTFPIAANYAKKLPVGKIGMRQGLQFLESQVKDPETRKKLTPEYGLGCKRPSFHNHYLKTFNRENVTLETTPIKKITKTGVSTSDGVSHKIDVLILATGFTAFDSDSLAAVNTAGRGGQDLAEFWDENRVQAYEGVSVPGFPNMFSILGPYGYNGASYFNLIETQTHHIIRLLKRAREQRATRIEVTREANDRYFAEMMRRRGNQIFWQDSCALANSYYFNKDGDVPIRAATTLETMWRAARFDLDDYEFAAA
ncbi:MAG: NAD(P)/FAD-dependent oxidoreductase [Solirubrobacteraceae bacterium]|nr:NAD(P)/FAD-dependent oxidoreductase [Solirubrobacteraceae bacterium]